MFKWLIIATLIYWGIWYFLAVNSTYRPISEQIDMKTMSIKKPEYIISKRSECIGTCQNYSSSSSSSSWWWWGWGWK